MSNYFDFVGKLSIGKETDKFKPYEEKEYQSGWANRTLKFNMISGSNRHMLEIKGGCWKDGNNEVKTYSKGEDGKYFGEPLNVPWAERNDKKWIEQVSPIKRFSVDLSEPGKRQKLQKAIESPTDESFAEAGVTSVEEAKAQLEQCEAKRHEFITEWDFAQFVHKLVSSDKIKDMKFVVKGVIDITEYNGSFYQHYIPNRIYRAYENAEDRSEASINVNFGNNAIDDGSLEEKGKYFINGFTFNYDSQRKTQIPCPVTLALPVGTDEKSKAYVNLMLKNFTIAKTDGDICKELTVRVDVINGAEKLELTEDMLSENEKELLIIGAVTMDDIVRDHGKPVYGDKIREWVVAGFARGWMSGAKATAYKLEDFVVPPLEDVAEKVSGDIFDDDEDDFEI